MVSLLSMGLKEALPEICLNIMKSNNYFTPPMMILEYYL